MIRRKVNIISAFKSHFFRMLLITVLISNIGNKMHEIGATWLMTSLTHNPLWIALIQSTHALSISIFAFVAGALSDIVNKRLYLLYLQTYMLMLSIFLAIITVYLPLTPIALLVVALLLDMGTALSLPTWQSLFPEVIDKDDLKSAVVLNNLATNIPRIIGPSIAGMLIANMGPAVIFLVNAVTFVGLISVLAIITIKKPFQKLPSEKLWNAIKSGVRYVREFPFLHVVMRKIFLFFFFSSCLWALFPLIARNILNADSYTYGYLYASFGIGAIFSSYIIHKIYQYTNADKLIYLCSLIYFIAMQLSIFCHNTFAGYLVMFMCGIAWALVTSTFNIVVQESVPAWVKARVIAFYYFIFYGSMALGGLCWGFLAEQLGIILTLKCASITLLVANFVSLRYIKINDQYDIEHAPSNKQVTIHKPIIDKPILVTIEYFVAEHNKECFKKKILKLRQFRLREGAHYWALFNDINNSYKFIECFMLESWDEYLRYHARFSVKHSKTQFEIFTYHENGEPIEKDYTLEI